MPHAESGKSIEEKLATVLEGLKEFTDSAEMERVIGQQAVEIQAFKRI
jgi:hypothetical protein